MVKSNDWNKNEFIALVLNYCAGADMNVGNEEIAWICNHCGKGAFEKANSFYRDHADFTILNTIADLRQQHFPGEQGKKDLLGEIKALFKADNKFSNMEKNVLLSLKRIL